TPTRRTRRTHQYLTRDDRLRIHTLHSIGLSHRAIADQLGVSKRQVTYALAAGRGLTPKQRKGRPAVLSAEQVDEIILFLRQNRSARQMSWQALATYFRENKGWNCTQWSVRHALK
ncbi:hypothetical protein CC80DRAFT_367646, partial [Byssothecium circinans]